MIYYKDENLVIRNMEEADDRIFYEEYTAQGWHPEIGACLIRLKDQAEGKCVALTAVYQGHPAGSVYVYLTAHEGPFKGKGVPEIFDFSVLQKYQRKGIGNKLMDVAEQIAGQIILASNRRASEEYRRHLCRVLTRRALTDVFDGKEEK